MRVFGFVIVVVGSVVASAGPRRPDAPAGTRASVVVDAPAAMAKLLKSTLGARFSVTVAKTALSDAPVAKEVRALTEPVGAIALVLGRQTGELWTLTVLNGADGTALDTQTFRVAGKKPVKALPKPVAGAIALACATGQPPAVSNGEPRAAQADLQTTASTPARPSDLSARPPTAAVSPGSKPTRRAALPAVRVGLGFRGFGRSLSWGGDPAQQLSRYTLSPVPAQGGAAGIAPAVALDAQWFPGAHFTSGVLANVGVVFQGEVVVGLASRQDASRFGTRASRYRLGGAFRQPLTATVELDAVGGFSTQTFSIDATAANDGSPRPDIPSVAFSGPRAGAGVRLGHFGPLSLDGLAAVTWLSGTGQLGTEAYFPRAVGFGLDATIGASVEVAPNLEVRLAIDWTRYFLTLNPQPGAKFDAPAAADQYVGAALTMNLVL